MFRGAFRSGRAGFQQSFRSSSKPFFKQSKQSKGNTFRAMGSTPNTLPKGLRMSALRNQTTKTLLSMAGARTGSMLARFLQNDLELVEDEEEDVTGRV